MIQKTPKQEELSKLFVDDSIKRLLIYGGARSGKSYLIIYYIFLRAGRCTSRHLIARFRFNHAKQSLWYETIPQVLEDCFPDLEVTKNKSDWFIELPNGSQVWIGGLDDKERTEKILGREYSTIYFNEASEISWRAVKMAVTRLAEKNDLTNKAFFDCNPPGIQHWTYKVWIEGKDPEKNIPIKNKDIHAYGQINPKDNEQNLSEGFVKDTLEGLTGSDRIRFLQGEYVKNVEGALWNMDLINKSRVMYQPEFVRKVIAVDPAVSSDEDSDETGIICVGIDKDQHGYIIRDLSGRYTPEKWARIVSKEYHAGGYDRVVAEVNNGGDLVEQVLRNVDKNISYKAVRASRGKAVRAEPVQALYEKGEIHHVGELPELELQMTTWNPLEQKSPDRVDALVWGCTEIKLQTKKFFVI